MSESFEGYFALSRLDKGQPMHTRIFYDQSKSNYVIEVDSHIKNFPSLDALVSSMIKEWQLVAPPTDGNILNRLLDHIDMQGKYTPQTIVC